MKKNLSLFFALSILTFTQAQVPKIDSTRSNKQKFSAGLKVNPFLLLIPNNNDGAVLYGSDCSVFFQYGAVGIFGGITPVYNTTLISSNKEVVPFLNLGAFFRLAQFSPTDAIYLYIYDLHASQLHTNYLMRPPGNTHFVLYPYYFQTENIFMFNPRYRSTALNKKATFECGVYFGFLHNVVDYNTSSTNQKSEIYPCFGTNVSLSLNIVALFAKKQ